MRRGYRFVNRKGEKPVSASRLPYILRSLRATEKATTATQNGCYTFHVDKMATKRSIKQAVETFFKVDVKAVNTLSVKGKRCRFKGFAGKKADYKKAMVTLKAGQIIDAEVPQ